MAIGTGASAQTAAPAPQLRPYAPGTPQYGVGGTPDRPARAILRQDEDWSWLGDVPPSGPHPLDPFKRIPLVPDGSVFASLGFQGRLRLESFDDASFGDRPGEDMTLHLRLDPQIGISFGDRARLYAALKYANVSRERFAPSIVDEQGTDLYQAFAEMSFGDAFGLPVRDVFARVGRQELHYGAGRIVSIRNGPNVRQDFDGGMVRARLGDTVVETLTFQPTEDDPGSFDNGTDSGEAIWGLYTSTTLGDAAPDAGLIGRSHLDLYYLGQRRDVSTYAFQAAPVDETRHTIGARLWTDGSPTDGWNVDAEAAFQFGTADGIAGRDGGTIRAGLLAGNLSYGFEDLPWTPVVELRAGIGTGDDDPSDDRLGTWRPLYPSGRYFGDSNPLGPGNIVSIAPAVIVSPWETVSITGRVQGFWRASDEDGLYGTSARPLRPGAGGERFIGHEVSLAADYRITDTVALGGVIARFEAGPSFDADPPGRDITYARLNLEVAF